MQAAAAAAVTGVGLGAVPLTTYALGIDPGLANLAGADAVFLAFLAATSAGVIASRLPLMARNKHAAEQVEADRKFYRWVSFCCCGGCQSVLHWIDSGRPHLLHQGVCLIEPMVC